MIHYMPTLTYYDIIYYYGCGRRMAEARLQLNPAHFRRSIEVSVEGG